MTDNLTIQSVLFEVEQAIKTGHCPWQIEAAFVAYESARQLLICNEAQIATLDAKFTQNPVAFRLWDKDPSGGNDDRWVYFSPDDFREGVDPISLGLEALYVAPKQKGLKC